MAYAGVQAIREAAGLMKRAQNETPQGAVDGINRAFVVDRRPIIDSNHDGEVDSYDVLVYVNGVAVDVESVDARTGTITLETAPAVNAEVLVDYCFGPLDDDYIAGKSEEADSWIKSKLRGVVDLPLRETPGVIETVAELYAAGLILVRDVGDNVDTELTSKDGAAKITLARSLLDDYIQGIKNEKQASEGNTNNTLAVASDPNAFGRYMRDEYYDEEDWFMRRHGGC